MGFSRNLVLVISVLVTGCATTSPPVSPPSAPAVPEVTTYRSADDAPRVLEAFDAKFVQESSVPSDLSNRDLNVYSHLLLAAGRFAEAEKALSTLADRQPSDQETMWALTLLAGARGDTAEQERRLKAFEALAPGDADAADLRARLLLARGDKKGAQNAWQSALTQGDRPGPLLGLAKLALEAKAPQEAERYAQRAAKVAPTDDQAWATLASALEAQQRYVEARNAWNQAVSLAPQDPWHLLDRGKLAFLHLYDFEAARSDLEGATIRDPENFFAWEALAEVYEELNRPRQAWDAYLKALSLRPDYRFAYPSVAMLSFRYQDWERAALYAKEAAKAYPGEYAFPVIEALSLRALGKIPAAQTVLEKARPRFVRGSTVDELFRFLLTPGTDSFLNTTLNLEKQETVRVRVRFYQGCFYALTKLPSSARAALEEVRSSTLTKIPEIGAAGDWLDHGI